MLAGERRKSLYVKRKLFQRSGTGRAASNGGRCAPHGVGRDRRSYLRTHCRRRPRAWVSGVLRGRRRMLRVQFSQARASAEGRIPELDWPLGLGTKSPEIAPMMDLLEFCARNIGEPIKGGWHSYFSHHHLRHDVEAGRAAFRAELDRLFRRNGVAFEMDENGLMQRLAPEGLREALVTGRFQTGDGALDRLLETARSKFLSPKIEKRREALKSLRESFERLKTVDAAGNKRAGIAALLDSAAGGPRFRQLLETEARSLTDAGNAFQIRHHEVGQEAIASSSEVDYLFHRLFALTQLLLAARGQ